MTLCHSIAGVNWCVLHLVCADLKSWGGGGVCEGGGWGWVPLFFSLQEYFLEQNILTPPSSTPPNTSAVLSMIMTDTCESFNPSDCLPRHNGTGFQNPHSVCHGHNSDDRLDVPESFAGFGGWAPCPSEWKRKWKGYVYRQKPTVAIPCYYMIPRDGEVRERIPHTGSVPTFVPFNLF